MSVSDRFLGQGENPFSYEKVIEGQGPQELLVDRNDFKGAKGKLLEWSKIATFEIQIVDKAAQSNSLLPDKVLLF